MGETTTYAGRYVPGLQHGGERTELTCTTTTPGGGTSHAAGGRKVGRILKRNSIMLKIFQSYIAYEGPGRSIFVNTI